MQASYARAFWMRLSTPISDATILVPPYIGLSVCLKSYATLPVPDNDDRSESSEMPVANPAFGKLTFLGVNVGFLCVFFLDAGKLFH